MVGHKCSTFLVEKFKIFYDFKFELKLNNYKKFI